MTTKELLNKVSVRNNGRAYEITIQYRSKEYICISHNSEAYDVVSHYGKSSWFNAEVTPSLKQALQELYNECKRVNGLR